MSGTIEKIGKPEKKSEKFTLQEIVVSEVVNGYANKVAFQLSQKQLEYASKWKVGQSVEVEANVKGREYNGKYFNTIEAWKVKVSGSGSAMQPNQDFGGKPDDSMPF